MRRESIAKACIIAGVILILVCFIMNYFFIKDSMFFIAGKMSNAVSIASEYSQKGESTAWENLQFIFTNGTVMGSNARIALYLGMLIDLVILAQAVLLIFIGLRDLSGP